MSNLPPSPPLPPVPARPSGLPSPAALSETPLEYAAQRPVISYSTALPQSYASGRVRTIVTAVLLGSAVLADLAFDVSCLLQLNLLEKARSGLPITIVEAQANDDRQKALLGVQMLLMIATAIALLMWMHRANRNLRALGASNLNFSPAGTVGWWFCPFANLVQPYRAMQEIYSWSAGAGQFGGPARGKSGLVAGWWAMFILAAVAMQIVQATAMPDPSGPPNIDSLIRLTWGLIAGSVPHIIAGVLGVFMVVGINRTQDATAQQIRRP